MPSNLLQVAASAGARCDGTGVGVSAGTVAECQGSTGSRRGTWTGRQNRYEMSWATHDPPCLRLMMTRSLIILHWYQYQYQYQYIYIYIYTYHIKKYIYIYIQISHIISVNIPEPTGFSFTLLHLFPQPLPFRHCATEAKKSQSLQDVLSKRVVQLEAKLHQQDMEKDAMKEETQQLGGLRWATGIMLEAVWTFFWESSVNMRPDVLLDQSVCFSRLVLATGLIIKVCLEVGYDLV